MAEIRPLASAEAESAARQLMGRYCRALDRLDAALLASLFWPDATIDMGALFNGGPEAFVATAMAFMGSMHTTRHELGGAVATGSHDAIAAETYVRAWHLIATPDGMQELVVLARYLNRFERRAGSWRILSHGEVVDWGEERAASSAWFAGAAELPKGARDRGDASYRILAAHEG